jgi:flagellar export protein FliJ
MSFRFALGSVLRLRQSIERQRTLALQEANLQFSRAQETLAQLDWSLSDSAESDRKELAAGRSGAELQFAAVLRAKAFLFRQELQSEIHRLEVVREQAVAAYHQAYREREVLETLRVRQFRVYQQDQVRRQQKELDASYLLQRWHRQN